MAFNLVFMLTCLLAIFAMLATSVPGSSLRMDKLEILMCIFITCIFWIKMHVYLKYTLVTYTLSVCIVPHIVYMYIIYIYNKHRQRRVGKNWNCINYTNGRITRYSFLAKFPPPHGPVSPLPPWGGKWGSLTLPSVPRTEGGSASPG